MTSAVLSPSRPAAPLTPSNHQQPRPSPSKRALSSPNSSPPLGCEKGEGGQRQESPRVLRTKLSYSAEERDVRGDTSSQRRVDGGATPPSPVGREEGARLIGLGVGLLPQVQQQGTGVVLDTTEEGATQTRTAQEQQRKLHEMPVELHQALAKLSSQHHMSEYNQLKQRTAMQLQLQQQHQQQQQQPPYPPPIRAVPLQRSHSSPPIGSTCSPSTVFAAPRPPMPPPLTIPAVPPQSTRPPILRAATNWPSIFRPVFNLANSVTSTPDRSRSSTPPVSGATELTGGTSLTPTLTNLAFDSSSPTPLNGSEEGSPTKDIAAALQDALKTNLERTSEIVPEEREPTPPPAPAPVFTATAHAQPPPAAPSTTLAPNGLLPGMKIINGVAVKTSVSHPMNISALVPPEYLARFGQAIFTDSSSIFSPRSPLKDSTSLNCNAPNSTARPFLLSRPSIGDLYDLLSTTLDAPVTTSSCALGTAGDEAGNGKPLGNFMLSSCPGKKVRMNGVQPKGGRSAICRDVSLDLGRAKEEGVGLVICCLDDSELSFLGAPWSEYSSAATSHSLTIIRIPMVEGFAPSSPCSLDAQLDRVIRQYTLQGRSVLAHCRGGIGRAGLVACCWLIKMAFVGAGEGEEVGEGEGEGEGEDRTMKVVQRVIEVIRKRRSVKSIETPVQVAFLLSYVAYLQEQATITRATELI